MANLTLDKKQVIFTKIKTKAIYRMNSKKTSNETKKMMSQELKDILISCKFNENEKCGNDEFVWRWDRDFGNCWSFNSAEGSNPDKKKCSIAGTFNGILF